MMLPPIVLVLLVMVILTVIILVAVRLSAGSKEGTGGPDSTSSHESVTRIEPDPPPLEPVTPPVAVCSLVSKRSFHGTSSWARPEYYVTFQFDDGERLEMMVPEKEFGLMVPGDTGKLTREGTVYVSFVRDRNAW